MILTKFKHACFVVTKNTASIVVDPGTFSDDFVTPDNVVATIITHQHPDHMDHSRLQAIAERNPDMTILGHSLVIQQLSSFRTQPVNAGDTVAIADIPLTFTGGTHATIHDSITPIANLGVHFGDALYYPGDSFTPPAHTVGTLALPAVAPWMKASEAIDFMLSIQPKTAFPTHDAILSSEGKDIYDRLYESVAASHAITYTRITTPIEL